jgi:protein tyrosine/serine phosphatase
MIKFNLIIITLLFSVFSQAEIVRFQELEKGRIFRGSQPADEQDYQRLKRLGVKTIVNLRWDTTVEKSQEMAKKYGFKFVNFPIKATDWPSSSKVNQVLKTISTPGLQPVYLHCQHGKDRTGLISALYRVESQGWSAEDAHEEWVEMGFSVKFLRALDQYFLGRTK